MRITIYALVDPRAPDIIRYVGQTAKPKERLRKHCKAAGRDRPTYRGHWIRQMLDEGVQPQLITLLRVQERHRNAAERDMIRRMREAGYPLVNGSIGGDGGALTPELQARATAKLREMFRSGELKAPTMTPEQKAARDARLSALRSTPEGNPMKRPEVRAKNAASQRARAAARGCVPKIRLKRGSPEWHAMITERNRASRTPAVCAKLAEALRGRQRTASHRAALSDAARAKTTLSWRGEPAFLKEIAADLGCSMDRIRFLKKRADIPMQEAANRLALDRAVGFLAAAICTGLRPGMQQAA